MEIKAAEFIAKVAQEFTYFDVEILYDYSGRGMYGSTTIGLAMDGEIENLLIPLAYMALEVEPGSQEAVEIEAILDTLVNISQDGLGLRKVYY